jgi:hypothetical protein
MNGVCISRHESSERGRYPTRASSLTSYDSSQNESGMYQNAQEHSQEQINTEFPHLNRNTEDRLQLLRHLQQEL